MAGKKGSTQKKNSGSKKTAPKKTTGTSSRSKTSKKETTMTAAEEIRAEQGKKEKKRRLVEIIWGLVYVALGAFIFFAVQFGNGGAFGLHLGNFLKGMFGLVGLLLPWYLIVIGILLMTKTCRFRKTTVILSVVLLLLLCLLNSGRFIDIGKTVSDVGVFYESGIKLKSGGFFGMFFGSLLVKAIGKTGLYIFSGVAVLIVLLVMLNTPLQQMMENRRNKKEEEAFVAAQEEAERKKQAFLLEQQRKEELRNDGVQLSYPVITDTTSGSSKKVQPPAEYMAAYNKAQKSGKSNAADFLSKSDPFAETRSNNGIGLEQQGPSGTGMGLSAGIVETTTSSTTKPEKVTRSFPWKKSKDPVAEPVTSGVTVNTGLGSEVGSTSSNTGRTGFGLEPSAPSKSGFGLEPESTPKAGYGLDGAPVAAGVGAMAGAVAASSMVGSDSQTTGADTHTDAMDSEAAEGPKKAYKEKKAVLTEETLKNTSQEASEGLKQPAEPAPYDLPPIRFLDPAVARDHGKDTAELREKAQILQETLTNFNVDAQVTNVTRGPAITRYEIQPGPGVKVSKIVHLADDIALNMRARSIRVEAPIPGKAAVGIEVNNEKIAPVRIREVIESKEFQTATSKIEFAVGKDIAGNNIVANLKDMPHLLIAGSTGSGKSVCINSIIASILYRARPDEVKLVLIDPKVVELGIYNGIPHLLIPVVTDPAKAAAALQWAVGEMTERYKKFAEEQTRDIAAYNRKKKAQGVPGTPMPQIVIIIDELADLMMAAPAQVQEAIVRIAQLARAAGMHLVVATQRPSVDIITGLIKANIPSRIAFAVSSQFDSRTILDMNGAEKLVGKGDMLFHPLGMGKPLRVQGTFISDEEVARVIDFVKAQAAKNNEKDEPAYDMDALEKIENSFGMGSMDDSDSDADELLPEAIEFVVASEKASTSLLQRRFRIGYNRAARMMDELEEKGIVGPPDGSKPRKVLWTQEEWELHMNGGSSGSDDSEGGSMDSDPDPDPVPFEVEEAPEAEPMDLPGTESGYESGEAVDAGAQEWEPADGALSQERPDEPEETTAPAESPKTDWKASMSSYLQEEEPAHPVNQKLMNADWQRTNEQRKQEEAEKQALEEKQRRKEEKREARHQFWKDAFKESIEDDRRRQQEKKERRKQKERERDEERKRLDWVDEVDSWFDDPNDPF